MSSRVRPRCHDLCLCLPACLSAPHRCSCLKTHGDSSYTMAATGPAQCCSPSCPFPGGPRCRKRPSCWLCDGFQHSTPWAVLRTSPSRGTFTPQRGPFLPQGLRNTASSVRSSQVRAHARARGLGPTGGQCLPWVLADLPDLDQASRASPSPRPHFSNFLGAWPSPCPLCPTHSGP